MATVNTAKKKNIVEIYKDLDTKIEYLVINGVRAGVAGFTSEEDRQKGLETIQKIVDSVESTDPYRVIPEVMAKLNTLASITENNIDPDEQVDVEGEQVMISYAAKSAYDMQGEELVNCTDLPDMPAEAIKAVLIERIKTKLAELKAAEAEDELSDLWDEED